LWGSFGYAPSGKFIPYRYEPSTLLLDQKNGLFNPSSSVGIPYPLYISVAEIHLMSKGIYKLLLSATSRTFALRPSRSITGTRTFNTSRNKMSDLTVELTAPNGRKYKQPIGIFINNEFVKSKSGEKITSIDPT